MKYERARKVCIHENSFDIDVTRIQSLLPADVKVRVAIESYPIERIFDGNIPDVYIRGYVSSNTCPVLKISPDSGVSAISDIIWTRQHYPDTKIIVLKNGLSREKALKNGAHDYLDRNSLQDLEEGLAKKIMEHLAK